MKEIYYIGLDVHKDSMEWNDIDDSCMFRITKIDAYDCIEWQNWSIGF